MILVVNSGSSSIKFRLFADTNQNPTPILEGIAERIGIDGNLKIDYQNQKQEFKIKMPNHEVAVASIYQTLNDLQVLANGQSIEAIGFRVVHGGDEIKESIVVNDKVKKVIAEMAKLAPLHNPGALTAIEAFEKTFPKTPLVACFDTAFHQSIPSINYLYSTPYEWYEKYQVRKYGFHGINYQFVTQKMATTLQKPVKNLNLVICHLGNGASICAVKNGQSLNTSMGLTPLAGLMMGTRSGDVDPSILAYLSQQTKKDVFELTADLNQASGLLGMSKISSDMRDVMQGIQEKKPLAILAYDKYCQTVADFIVQYLNQIGQPVDALVFTAGIGENSDEVRQKIIDDLPLLKVSLDQDANVEKYQELKLISDRNSTIPIYAVRANEELMICQEALRLTKK